MQDIVKKSPPPSSRLLVEELPDPAPITLHRKRRYLGLFGLLGLIAASQATFLLKPSLGVYITVGAFIAIIATALMRQSFRYIGVTLAIVPLLTMLLIVLPISDQTIRVGIYYGLLLALSLIYRFFLFRDPPFVKVTVRRNFLAIGGLILLGVVCGGIYFLLPNHSYPFHSLPLYSMIIGCSIAALAEELFFRGLVQQKALQVVSPTRAIVAVAVLYACMSIGTSLSWGIIGAFVFAGLLSLIYRYVPNPLLTFIVNVSAKLTFVILISMYV